MHRFYVTHKPAGNYIILDDGEQLHHAREVLRLKVGDEVAAFDIAGNEYLCTIEKIDKQQVSLDIKARKSTALKSVHLTIACAIPKQTRMDDIVDKLTQLGVDMIIPMETERVIVKLDNRKKTARQQHWQKIALSATQQSQRNTIPGIAPVTDISNILEHSQNYDLKLIPTLGGKKQYLRELLAEKKPHNIMVLIGPEGDFTPEEVARAQATGFIPVSLGEAVLRVDTAAITVASYINLALT
ncbi:MAG: RsmE family RNA methyltransferase [Dehalococcoidales bacterium]|nr:RsmE family RNA methyltransferase [Dehalococcoidales bacterium]